MFRYARSFCVLAEELHFGRAAARLGISQPALSHRMKMLEQEIGCTLVSRSPHHVSLNEAGAGLARELSAAMAQIARARQTAVDVARGQAGALSIGYGELLWSGGLIPIVQRYRELFPNIQVSLRALTTNEQVEALLNGSIDIGILHPPVVAQELMLIPAGQERLVAAFSLSHRFGASVVLHVADLAAEPLIFCSAASAPALHRRIMDSCAAAGFDPCIGNVGEDWHSMAAGAAAGIGVAMLPESLCTAFAAHLSHKPIADFPHTLQTAIATLQSRTRPAVTGFEEIATTFHSARL